jgi:hypothetical protein
MGLDVLLSRITAAAVVADQGGKASSIVRLYSTFKESIRNMAEWRASLNPDVAVMESKEGLLG